MPPDDDVLEACAELGGGLAVVVTCAEVLVLVCSVVLAAVVDLAV